MGNTEIVIVTLRLLISRNINQPQLMQFSLGFVIGVSQGFLTGDWLGLRGAGNVLGSQMGTGSIYGHCYFMELEPDFGSLKSEKKHSYSYLRHIFIHLLQGVSMSHFLACNFYKGLPEFIEITYLFPLQSPFRESQRTV